MLKILTTRCTAQKLHIERERESWEERVLTGILNELNWMIEKYTICLYTASTNLTN